MVQHGNDASSRITPFSGAAAIRIGWDILTRQFGQLVFAHALLLFLLLLGTFCCFIPGILLTGPLWVGYVRMGILVSRGREVALRDLFWAFEHLFLQSFLLGLIFMLLTAAGSPIFGVLLNLAMPLLAEGLTSPRALVFLWTLTMLSALTLLLPTLIAVFFYGPSPLDLLGSDLEAWPAMERCRKRVLANRDSWLSFWGWIALAHLLVLLTCGAAIFIVNPLTMTALIAAHELEQGRFSPRSPG